MNPAKIEKIFEKLSAYRPAPESELFFSSPFELLIAVILSAQATDIGVNKATPGLFALANTPQKMLDLGEKAVLKQVKTIGLSPTKTKNILITCKILLEKHNGEVPQTREELEELAGVGRKTANVVLNVAFGHPTLAVDTHVFRVSNRTGMAPGKNVREVEDNLLKVVPEKFIHHAHHQLILQGRHICKARKPECSICPIKTECDFKEKTA